MIEQSWQCTPMSSPLHVSSACNTQAKHKHTGLICRGQRGKAGEFTWNEKLGGGGGGGGEREAAERVKQERKSVREQEGMKRKGE